MVEHDWRRGPARQHFGSPFGVHLDAVRLLAQNVKDEVVAHVPYAWDDTLQVVSVSVYT